MQTLHPEPLDSLSEDSEGEGNQEGEEDEDGNDDVGGNGRGLEGNQNVALMDDVGGDKVRDESEEEEEEDDENEAMEVGPGQFNED